MSITEKDLEDRIRSRIEEVEHVQVIDISGEISLIQACLTSNLMQAGQADAEL